MKAKGCLKFSPVPSRSASPSTDSRPIQKKYVTWCLDSPSQVFEADDYDRTPHEPVRSLSYQETLELKSIQRTLPYADQPADPLTGRPGSARLQNVPLTLLPLLSDATQAPNPHSFQQPTPVTSLLETLHANPPGVVRQSFQFLPLTDSSSYHSDCQLPSRDNQKRRRKKVFEINGMEFEMSDDEEDDDPVTDEDTDYVEPEQPTLPPAQPNRPSKKRIIIINDMEIELSDDESDEDEEEDPSTSSPPYTTDEDEDDNTTASSYTTSQVSTPMSSPPPTPPQKPKRDNSFIQGSYSDLPDLPARLNPQNRLRGRMPILQLL